MDETVVLWSGQAQIVLDTLSSSGVYQVKRTFVEQKYGQTSWSFQLAYAFFVREASVRLQPPEGAQSPIWCYTDPRWVDVSQGSSLLKITAPRDQILLFDMYKWNRILNLSYLADGEEDEVAFERDLRRQGISSSVELFRTPYYPQMRRRVEESWRRLFETPVEPGDPNAQAALWEIRQPWVEIL